MTLNGPTTSYNVKENPFTGVPRRESAFFNDRLEGLSRMRENSQVRFLGGWAGATLPGYSTICTYFSITNEMA